MKPPPSKRPSRGRAGGRAAGSGFHFQDLYVAWQLAKLLTVAHDDPLIEVMWEKNAVDLQCGQGVVSTHGIDVILRTHADATVFVQIKEKGLSGIRQLVHTGLAKQLYMQWSALSIAHRSTTRLRISAPADCPELRAMCDLSHRSRSPLELLSDEAAGDLKALIRFHASYLQLDPLSNDYLLFLQSLEVEQVPREVMACIRATLVAAGDAAPAMADRLVRLVGDSKHSGSSSNSSFTRDALIEVLNRDPQLVSGLKRMNALASDAKGRKENLRTRWLAARKRFAASVQEQTEGVLLPGHKTNTHDSRFERFFLEPSLSRSTRTRSNSMNDRVDPRRLADEQGEEEHKADLTLRGQRAIETVRVESLLESLDVDANRWLGIVGVAGRGKSTLLRQMANRLARRVLERPKDRDRPLPVLVRLGNLKKLRPKHVVEDLLNQSAFVPRFDADEVAAINEAEPRWVFLLDGFDELRPQFREILSGAMEPVRRSIWVISSRPEVLDSCHLPQFYVNESGIAPYRINLNRWPVRLGLQFVKQYFRDDLVSIHRVNELFGNSAGDRIDQGHTTDIRNEWILTDPYLLSVFCDLFSRHLLQLPPCAAAIMKDWVEQQLGERRGCPLPTLSDLMDILGILAEQALFETHGWLSEQSIDRTIRRYLGQHRLDHDAGEVLAWLVDKSGLLHRSDADRGQRSMPQRPITFHDHRMMEYLCAYSMAGRANAGDWRTVRSQLVPQGADVSKSIRVSPDLIGYLAWEIEDLSPLMALACQLWLPRRSTSDGQYGSREAVIAARLMPTLAMKRSHNPSLQRHISFYLVACAAACCDHLREIDFQDYDDRIKRRDTPGLQSSSPELDELLVALWELNPELFLTHGIMQVGPGEESAVRFRDCCIEWLNLEFNSLRSLLSYRTHPRRRWHRTTPNRTLVALSSVFIFPAAMIAPWLASVVSSLAAWLPLPPERVAAILLVAAGCAMTPGYAWFARRTTMHIRKIWWRSGWAEAWLARHPAEAKMEAWDLYFIVMRIICVLGPRAASDSRVCLAMNRCIDGTTRRSEKELFPAEMMSTYHTLGMLGTGSADAKKYLVRTVLERASSSHGDAQFLALVILEKLRDCELVDAFVVPIGNWAASRDEGERRAAAFLLCYILRRMPGSIGNPLLEIAYGLEDAELRRLLDIIKKGRTLIAQGRWQRLAQTFMENGVVERRMLLTMLQLAQIPSRDRECAAIVILRHAFREGFTYPWGCQENLWMITLLEFFIKRRKEWRPILGLCRFILIDAIVAPSIEARDLVCSYLENCSSDFLRKHKHSLEGPLRFAYMTTNDRRLLEIARRIGMDPPLGYRTDLPQLSAWLLTLRLRAEPAFAWWLRRWPAFRNLLKVIAVALWLSLAIVAIEFWSIVLAH